MLDTVTGSSLKAKRNHSIKQPRRGVVHCGVCPLHTPFKNSHTNRFRHCDFRRGVLSVNNTNFYEYLYG